MERKTKQLEGKINNTKYQSYIVQAQDLKQDIEKKRDNLEKFKSEMQNKENVKEITTQEEVKFKYRVFNLCELIDLFVYIISHNF